MRRLLAGDSEGYYRDYSGTTANLAQTIKQGWFHTGDYSVHRRKHIGTDPSGIPPRRFVICLQNHDQVGNRAKGERLHHQVPLPAYRAASALLLCAPQTPLLFMGQEWAASTPFLFFTDHHEELGRLVTDGRRQEFKDFAAFSDEAARQTIPDPQTSSTFIRSKLLWPECEQEPHASILRLYQALLRLRRTEPALRAPERDAYSVTALTEDAILLQRCTADEPGCTTHAIVVVAQLRNAGTVYLGQHLLRETQWKVLFTTEEPAFAPQPCPPRIELNDADPHIEFQGPAAVILREAGAR
jgi:maltooligosyltrehalose trehalohydrolase